MLMRRKMMKPAVAVAALMMSSTALQADEINLYSVNTGSWIYHLSNNHGQYTEGFDNQFASVERRFSEDSPYSLLAGTMKNSFDDRCIALGVRRDWVSLGNGWVFKGIYGYVGEFFSRPSSTAAIMVLIRILKTPPASAFLPIFIMVFSTTLPIISALKAELFFPPSLW